MRRRDIIVAAIAVALTLFAGLVALNFRTGEKQIEQKVARLYATQDAQFARAMGVLLGPPILDGNRFESRERRRDFPSMLAAIRARDATISFESYIYWSGEIGKRVRRGARRTRPRGRQGPRAARLAGQRQDGPAAACSTDGSRQASRSGVPRAAVVSPCAA